MAFTAKFLYTRSLCRSVSAPLSFVFVSPCPDQRITATIARNAIAVFGVSQLGTIEIKRRLLSVPSGLSLTRGLSLVPITGRLPVDLSAENIPDIPAENRGIFSRIARNPLSLRRKQRQTSDHAFSPTDNCADLKATPHE